MNVHAEEVRELQRGEALFINKEGKWHTQQVLEPKANCACSFERIYFSRGSDVDIYQERKLLGKNLVSAILKSVDNDLNHTVFSFIPNTAEVAYFGLLEGLNEYLNKLNGLQTAVTCFAKRSWSRFSPCGYARRRWPSRILSCGRLSRRATAGTIWRRMCMILPTEALFPTWIIWS